MWPPARANVPALAIAAVGAIAIKLAGARLGPDQLFWIARPTASIVSVLTGLPLTQEAGYGYVNLTHRIVLARSCLGVNYLAIVFTMLAFTLVSAMPGWWRKILLLLPIAGAAGVLTILVNGARIALGIHLHEAGASWGWLTPERVHRLLGVALYVPALLCIDAAARRLTCEAVAGRLRASVVFGPLLWYGLFAIGLPLVNGALYGRAPLFIEHGATVLAFVLALGGAIHIHHWGSRRRRRGCTP